MQLIESRLYIDALKKVQCDGLNGKTIVITGATGMIGSCLVDVLAVWNRDQQLPCRIVAISRSRETAKRRFAYCWNEPFFSFVEQDVCNEPKDWPEHVDYVIHAASNADPVNFARAPVDTLVANVVGTDLLMKSGCQRGMKRFLYVSSGEMYGQPNENVDDFVEDYCGPVDHSASRACYPAGKRAAEVLCQCYISQYQVDAVIVRPCHIFGPTMTAGDSRAVSEFLRNAVDGKNIGMKSAGLIERSHCYVVDAAAAILLVLTRGKCGEAYNIADKSYQMTIRDFAQAAAKAGGCSIVFEDPSDMEVRGYSKVSRAVLNAGKLEALGWTGRSGDLSAIEETVNILRELKERS